MIAGSYNAVLHTSLTWSYILSLLPPATFMAVCFKTKASTQTRVAAFLSACYAVVMLTVVVGKPSFLVFA